MPAYLTLSDHDHISLLKQIFLRNLLPVAKEGIRFRKFLTFQDTIATLYAQNELFKENLIRLT